VTFQSSFAEFSPVTNPAALPTAHITASVDQVVLFAAGLSIGIPAPLHHSIPVTLVLVTFPLWDIPLMVQPRSADKGGAGTP